MSWNQRRYQRGHRVRAISVGAVMVPSAECRQWGQLDRGKRMERGQTTLDFALGVSIFIGIIIFVFMFVPGILQPFSATIQEETVAANRVADGLTDGRLGSPSDPGVLDRRCTVWFFDNAGGGGESSPSDCEFTGRTVHERLGLADRQRLNVTVAGNVSTGGGSFDALCWDGNAGALAEVDGTACSDSGDVRLASGPASPKGSASTVSAVRVASLAGEDVTIYVEMW